MAHINQERLVKLLERLQHASTEDADLLATVAAYRRLLGTDSPADLLGYAGGSFSESISAMEHHWQKQVERVEKSRDDAWNFYNRANADLERVKAENTRLRKQAREGSKAQLKRDLAKAMEWIELLADQLSIANSKARQKPQPQPAQPDAYFEYAR